MESQDRRHTSRKTSRASRGEAKDTKGPYISYLVDLIAMEGTSQEKESRARNEYDNECQDMPPRISLGGGGGLEATDVQNGLILMMFCLHDRED